MPIWPTNPAVPIPADEPIHCNLISVVEIGPKILEAIIVGSQIIGFFKMFLNCNMLVPIPIDKTIPNELSFLDWTANPTIWVQQPIKAAPEAINKPCPSPINIIAAIAAEDIGAVKAIPMITENIIPIKIGWIKVASLTIYWIPNVTYIIGYLIKIEKIKPTIIPHNGINKISTGVFFWKIIFNNKQEIITTI